MGNWENGIFGLVPQDEWLNTEFNPTRQSDPIDGLLGDTKTDNLMAKWQTIAAEYQIPVMAQFHGFDTEAQTTFRVPVDTHNIEKGLIKVKLNQSERLRALTRAGVRKDEMYDYVLNDGVRLADQVITRTKVAKNELLATGKVTIKENNLDLTVDYGVPADQLGFELDFAGDITEQLQAIIDAALEKGVTLTGMVTSRTILTKMRKNVSVQKAINGNIGVGSLVKMSALTAWLDEEYGITRVITNDLTYGVAGEIGDDGLPSITQSRYFPANKITFFSPAPSGRLGIGLWGNPPEADDPEIDMPTSTSGVDPYVFISQWIEKDPKVLWTKASSLFMPVLYNPSSLWICSTKESEAVTESAGEG